MNGMATFCRRKIEEALDLARYYERVPEDLQKAAGARQARKDAEYWQRRLEEELATNGDDED